jgi:hypothetical protein
MIAFVCNANCLQTLEPGQGCVKDWLTLTKLVPPCQRGIWALFVTEDGSVTGVSPQDRLPAIRSGQFLLLNLSRFSQHLSPRRYIGCAHAAP